MVVLLQLVRKYELWLLGLCAMVFFFYVRRAWQARRDRAASFFGLEKEVATSNLLRSVGGALFSCLLAAGIYYVSGYVAADLELPEVLGAEPTPLLIPTLMPTATPGPPTPLFPPTDAPTRAPIYTPTPLATPGEPPTPVPQVVAPVCPDPSAQLTSPGAGQVVQGVVQVQGTAQIQDFDYYKFEFRGVGSEGEWAFLQRFDQPVAGGVLGTWNAGALPDAEYEFRLVVVRLDGNYKICSTRVIVKH